MLARELGDDGVLVLTLDAPERRNALDYAAVRELLDAFRAAEDDPAVRAVLLNANGDVFSAGANLREFQREIARTATQFHDSGGVWEELFTYAPTMGVPIVVAVGGPARAGAVGLVTLGDLVLASERADFALSEIRIGLFPIMVLPMVMRVVGYRNAQDLALTGRTLEVEEARAMGLVTRVVAQDVLEVEAREVASSLAASAPRAMAYGRRLIARLADLPYDQAVHHARTMRGAFLHTADLAEGIAAFLEKRSPAWPDPAATRSTTQEDPS